MPFDIPDSWAWCRLATVNDMYTGNSYKIHYMGLSQKFNLRQSMEIKL